MSEETLSLAHILPSRRKIFNMGNCSYLLRLATRSHISAHLTPTLASFSTSNITTTSYPFSAAYDSGVNVLAPCDFDSVVSTPLLSKRGNDALVVAVPSRLRERCAAILASREVPATFILPS